MHNFTLFSLFLLFLLNFKADEICSSKIKNKLTEELILPDLEYSYNDLEPYISEEIMKLHHSKHHQAYVDNYNKALNEFSEGTKNVPEILSRMKFNRGGHINHAIFWTNLSPVNVNGGNQNYDILNEIKQNWGNFKSFKEEFNKKALSIQVFTYYYIFIIY